MSVELVPADAAHLPHFSPGAHVDLHLSNGLVRSYSLLNSTQDADRYVLGILLDPKGRGGSRHVHEQLRCGTALAISAPRNHFALDEGEHDSLLVAGGIGITPILCMYRRLCELGRRVRIVYCARSARQAPFLAELTALGGDIVLHFDDEHGGRPFDLERLLAEQPKDIHAYCCGPSAMISAFEAACASHGIGNAHVERFAAPSTIAASNAPGGSYTVYLKRSDRTVEVPTGQSLLDALLAADIRCDHSCREGVCGACETGVLDGQVEHRDFLLSDAEKAASKTMLICVSTAKDGGPLVLDL